MRMRQSEGRPVWWEVKTKWKEAEMRFKDLDQFPSDKSNGEWEEAVKALRSLINIRHRRILLLHRIRRLMLWLIMFKWVLLHVNHCTSRPPPRHFCHWFTAHTRSSLWRLYLTEEVGGGEGSLVSSASSVLDEQDPAASFLHWAPTCGNRRRT